MEADHETRSLRDRRFAANQTIFRRSNERLRRSQEDRSEAELYECECGADRCGGLVSLLPHEYEHVRSSPKWFLIAPRHAILADGSERIVESYDRYGVAEKSGAAGDLAEALATRPT
jgi:hypothetical protein